VGEGADVFDVVVDLAFFFGGCAAAGFAGVDAFEDAEAAEVFEGDLEAFEAGGAADEGGVETGVVAFLFFTEAGEFAFGAHSRVGGGFYGFFFDFSFYAVAHL